MKKYEKIFIERKRSMDKVAQCLMDAKEGKKDGRKIMKKDRKPKKC